MSAVIEPATGVFDPDDSRVSYSDYAELAVSSGAAVFSRPIIDGFGFEHCAPAARVRFRSDALSITLRLYFTDLTTHAAYNDVGSVLVDGTAHSTFTSPGKGTGAQRKDHTLTFDTRRMRRIEVLLPYGCSVDYVGVEQDRRAYFLPCVPRPAPRLVALGDSITQGFNATDSKSSWSYLVGVAKGWQVVNLGYGSRVTVPSDGTLAGVLDPDLMTVLLGHNDFGAQTALATFKSNYKDLLTNIRGQTSAPIYAITLLWTNANYGALTAEQYRQQIRDAVSELALPNVFLIEGEPLATNSTASFPDGVHPNDAGEAQIAANLGALLP